MTMAADVTNEVAIQNLGAATAQAVAQVLEAFVPGGVLRGDVTVAEANDSPFTNLPKGGVAASVRYVDGVTGANVFMMPADSARTLAAAMGAGPEPDGAPLSEIEISAIGEAANQMLAAAASAISVLIGQQVSITPPDVTVIGDESDPVDLWGTSPHACTTSFTVGGAPCRLIQLLPNAFVVRVARAISEMSADCADDAGVGTQPGGELGQPVSLDDSLGGVRLRLWAELGRTQMALGTALSLPAEAVIELDEPADNPVELYINGLRLGTARLLVTDDGDWAIEILTLTDPATNNAVDGLARSNPPEDSPEPIDREATADPALTGSVSPL